MKQIVVLLLSVLPFVGVACDVCGGISSPGTDGLLNGNRFHFIGLRTSYSSYKSIHRNSFSQDVITSREHFTNISLAGRWQFADRFAVQVGIPYRINVQYISSEERLEHGLGDITAQINWIPIHKKNENGLSNSLVVTAGIKAPTGRYSSEAWETSNLLPGTGSWDPQFGLNYRLGKNNIGFLLENQFSLKTANKYGYQYGNSFASQASVLYTIKTKKEHKILPSLGVGYLFTDVDRINGYWVSESFNAGHVINVEVGINYLTTHWMFNTKWSYPIVQTISNGDVVSQGTVSVGIHYLIQKQ